MNCVPHAWVSLVHQAPRALVLAVALAAAGCGDDEPTDTDTDTSTTTTTTGDPTTTDTTTTTTSASTTTTAGAELSHAADIQPLWDNLCVAACHDDNPMSSGVATTGLMLLPATAYDAIVNKMSVPYPALTLITPGDRDASYLFQKLNGDQMLVGGGGSKMPLGKTMSADDIEKVGQWIDQGAKP